MVISIQHYQTTNVSVIEDIRKYENNLVEAVNQIGSDEKIILIPSGESITSASNLTIPKNITLRIENGGIINFSANLLDIEGQVDAGPYQAFNGTGPIRLRGDVHAEWLGAVGDGSTNDTPFLQRLINALTLYGGTVHFRSATYIMQTLDGKSNVNYVLQPGTVLQAIDDSPGWMMRFVDTDNVIIQGNGGKFNGVFSITNERMNLRIVGTTNMSIFNLRSDEGQDGFYVAGGRGDGGSTDFAEKITFKDCSSDHCNRNGFAIVSAKDALISGCRSTGHRGDGTGTNIGAAFNVEPDAPNEEVRNVVIENCVALDAYRTGFSLHNTPPISPLGNQDIYLKNCIVRDMSFDFSRGFSIQGHRENSDKGRIVLRDCSVFDCYGHGLWISNKSPDHAYIEIYNMRLDDVAKGDAADFNLPGQDNPVIFYNNGSVDTPSGGVFIDGLDIRDKTRDRNPIWVNASGGSADQFIDVIIKNLRVENTVGTTNFVPAVTADSKVFIEWRDRQELDRTINLPVSTRHHDILVHNSSASGEITCTLPDVTTVGDRIKLLFQVRSSNYLRITPDTNDTIFPDGTGDGKYIRSNTIGSHIEIRKMDSTGWFIANQIGTWEAEA